MKFLIFVTLSVITIQSYSQESVKPIQKFLNNCDQVYVKSDNTGDNLITDLKQTLVQYFNIESKYPTPLKQNLFSQSKEGKILNDSFQKHRTRLNRTKYISFQPSTTYGKIIDYNLSRLGFMVYIQTQYSGWTNINKKFGDLIFTNLNTEFKIVNNGERKHEFIFIPCNKKYGSLIESDNSSSLVYIFFKPLSVVNKRIVFDGFVDYFDFLNTRVSRIILTYKDEIIYNKTF